MFRQNIQRTEYTRTALTNLKTSWTRIMTNVVCPIVKSFKVLSKFDLCLLSYYRLYILSDKCTVMVIGLNTSKMDWTNIDCHFGCFYGRNTIHIIHSYAQAKYGNANKNVLTFSFFFKISVSAVYELSS